MEVQKRVPCRSDLHSLLVNQLSHIGDTRMKEAMIQGIEETLAEPFELDVQAPNTEIKSALSGLFELALVDVILERTLATISIKSFDRVLHSECL